MSTTDGGKQDLLTVTDDGVPVTMHPIGAGDVPTNPNKEPVVALSGELMPEVRNF
jgi:hypothetical protein